MFVLSLVGGVALTYGLGYVKNDWWVEGLDPLGDYDASYGFPLIWRTTLGLRVQIDPLIFALDALFWTVMLFIAIFLLNGIRNF